MHSEQEQGKHNLRTDGHHSKETQQAANQPHKHTGQQKQTAGGAVLWLCCFKGWMQRGRPLTLTPYSLPPAQGHLMTPPLLPPLPKSQIPLHPWLTGTDVKVDFRWFSFDFRRYFLLINFLENLLTARMPRQTKWTGEWNLTFTLIPRSALINCQMPPSHPQDGALLFKRENISCYHEIEVLQWPWGPGPDERLWRELCESEGLFISRQWARC